MSSAPAPTNPAPQAVQSPLTLIMKIKSPQAYAELNAILTKIQSMPIDKNPLAQALISLRNVHFARFVFLHNNTELAVITTYDGTFESYINEFVDSVGDIFNELLARMDGAPALPVQKNRDAFLAYVKANDLRSIEPFFSAYPTATVLDIQSAISA